MRVESGELSGMNSTDVRWVQRFGNFERAYLLLSGALQGKDVSEFDDLQREGLIQRFEFTFELLWKTLKDYLDFEEVSIEIISPKGVIKAAAASNILGIIGVRAECLLSMLEARNAVLNVYDEDRFVRVLSDVKENHLAEITGIYLFFKGKINHVGSLN